LFLYRLVFSPDKKTKPVTLGVLTHFLLNILIREKKKMTLLLHHNKLIEIIMIAFIL